MEIAKNVFQLRQNLIRRVTGNPDTIVQVRVPDTFYAEALEWLDFYCWDVVKQNHVGAWSVLYVKPA